MSTQNRANPIRLYLLMALALFGLGVSVYLTYHYYEVRSGAAGFKSLCNIGSRMNCDAVAASSYAELFLGIPLSSFGAGWYLGLLAIFGFALNGEWRREALRVALAMTGFGLVLSLAYLFVMVGVLETYCLFCLILDATAFVTFLITLSLRPKERHPTSVNRSQWKGMAATVVGCVFIAVVALKGFDQTNFKSSDVQWMVQEVLSRAPLSVGTDEKYPSIGPKDASVTVVEFSDFQCPYCRLGAMTVNTLLNRYPKKLRVVFRNYPLDPSCNSRMQHSGHPVACEAARVGYCANQQGKFKEVYEEIFENQASLAPGKAEELAKKAGVDPQKLEACLKAPETQAAIQADIEEGTRLGVESTPTFLINGRKVDGVMPVPVWNRIIDQLAK